MIGRRLSDRPLSGPAKDDTQPGDYWRCQDHNGERLLDVLNHPEDRGYWGNVDAAHWAGNLTGGVWGVIDPFGNYGMLSIHTVREHEDGTISVRPGDGSSNSILIQHGDAPAWHGYIDHGVWEAC